MKKQLIKFFDKIILLLLGLPGVFGCREPFVDNPRLEYGVPHANFEITGTVTDKATAKPVQNIRLIRQYRGYPEYGDTLYTKRDGKYDFNFGDFPETKNTFKLKIEDIDGDENGGLFKTKEIEVEITKADQTEKGSGWYSGKFVKTQNIELDKADVAMPMYGVLPSTFQP